VKHSRPYSHPDDWATFVVIVLVPECGITDEQASAFDEAPCLVDDQLVY
jgi:hypothetical protein